MSRQTIFTVVAVIATIAIGIICGRFGIDMLYKGTMATIGPVSFSTGLVLLMLGFVLIVLALETIKGRRLTLELFAIGKRTLWDLVIPLAILALLIVITLRLVPPAFSLVDQTWLGILAILLALLGAIGGLLWWFLRRDVREAVERDIKRQFSEIRGKLAIAEGFSLYSHGYYEPALRRTKDALDERLDELDIIWAKNNLAYYYAKIHEQQPLSEIDRRQAESCAKLVHKKYDKYRERFNRPTWVETYAFVKARLAVNKEERQKVRDEINNMLKRADLESVAGDLNKSLDHLDELDLK